jgi:hypothetical protein
MGSASHNRSSVLLLEKEFVFSVWLFISRDSNFPDRRGGGLACHGEPFDHATVETRILEQIKCLKNSGKNSTLPNHQIPFLNISQRLELVST